MSLDIERVREVTREAINSQQPSESLVASELERVAQEIMKAARLGDYEIMLEFASAPLSRRMFVELTKRKFKGKMGMDKSFVHIDWKKETGP